MTKTPILENIFYTRLIQYIYCHKKVRSYEITKKFNPEINKVGKFRDKIELKNYRCNFSMTIQNLLRINLIKIVGKGSRGRHGKYHEYSINYKGIVKFLFTHYLKIKTEELIDIDYESLILVNLIKDYFQQKLNEDVLGTLDYLFDYFIKHMGEYRADYEPKSAPTKKSIMDKIRINKEQNAIMSSDDFSNYLKLKKHYDYIKNIIGKGDYVTLIFLFECRKYNHNKLFNN